MIGATLAAPKVRSVTNAEVDFFFQHGWVKIPQLIERDTAADLLHRARSVFGEDGRAGIDQLPKPAAHYETWFRTTCDAMEDERFRALSLSTALGNNTARLLGRDGPIRLMLSDIGVKLPVETGRGNPTTFHQDTPGHPYIESNFLTAWVALDEVAADMGALQFYSGSHKLGNLGYTHDPAIRAQWQPILDKYCVLTEPVTLQPGDATFHINGTMHGTQANTSGQPRWSWMSVMVPGDARYTGAPHRYIDGRGFTQFGQLDHPTLPIIYSPEIT
ncbi:phytanoyl-CoA dioxygenase family protein [Sphingobium indicum]|nr:phytanoyl-CoA dioxygenase family protein [Sphingobium indicum]